ncbi:F-box/kelch-repeat protein [Hibiscus syriacus]|uniref:F-box/kelch-repeat protein n=1 Tax=Hibiscus syriacus TaxID=106335 RepID=A0A6A3CRL4_HIBSY|nr:F-box/kelch-repeat protein [Hibiscus syriacus]
MPKYGSIETSSSSSGPVRRVMSNANFSVELFDGSGHFGMWQGEVLDALFQQGLDIAIEEENPEYGGKMGNNQSFGVQHDSILSFQGAEVWLQERDFCNYELKKKTKKESKYEEAEAMVARGHWKKDCPKLKKKEKAAPDACVVEHDAHDSDISQHSIPMSSIRLKNQDGSTRVLTDVRYVPSLKKNLISLGAVESKGSVVTMRDGVLKVTYGALVMMKGIRKNNLYYYQGSTIIGAVAAASGVDDLDATQLWHMRLGHAGEKSLQILAKKGLLKVAKACKLNFCKHCVLGKQKRVKFGTTIHNTKDDFSRRVWVYPMKSKDEVLQIFLKWKNMIENQTGRKIKRLRTDNGGEYKSDPFFDVCYERKTLFEVWSGKPATDYYSLHVFGSTAYYHVKESKLDPRAKKALFMGITHGVKGFRLWCLDTKKIIYSRDVTFDESALVKKVTSEAVQTSSTPQQVEHTPKQVEFQQMMIPEVDLQGQGEKFVETARFVDMVAYALPVVDDDIPITYQEAIQSLESDKWKSAMDEEMQSLQKNDTWKLAQLPKGKRAIGCKWVFVKKYGSHKTKDVCYKARLVAKGYAQKEGIDYNKVFSPVVKHSSIRILLALVAQLNLELAQLDVKTAFLHGDLEEEIYMTQPEGYKDGGCEKWLKDGSFIYPLLYVVDMLIASKSQKEIDKLKAQLNQEFEMKDLGEAKKILGMEISRDRQRGKLCLTQKQYLRKVLQCFGMNENTKHVSIPLASHLKLSSQLSPKTNEERVYMAKVPYANAVGSLMYAMVCTRPDISQALGVVSRYMHDPGEGHWQAVKWILRYLQQTVDVGLVFEQDEALAPVSWKSTLQSTVALSTTEAEYMVVSEAVKEAIWLNGLMEDLGVVQSYISLYCDSQSAIHLAKNQVYHSRTKHIDVRYHFVREIFEEGKILLQKIATSENPADMMTKVRHYKFGELKKLSRLGNFKPRISCGERRGSQQWAMEVGAMKRRVKSLEAENKSHLKWLKAARKKIEGLEADKRELINERKVKNCEIEKWKKERDHSLRELKIEKNQVQGLEVEISTILEDFEARERRNRELEGERERRRRRRTKSGLKDRDETAFDPIQRKRMYLPKMPPNDCFTYSDKEFLAVGIELLVSGKEVTSQVIYRYSTLTNSWTPRCLFGSASLGEISIIVSDCDSRGNILGSAEMYNSVIQRWETLPSMNTPRKMCSGIFMDKKVYVLGGTGGVGSNATVLTCGEEYDLEIKKWTQIPNMSSRRSGTDREAEMPAVAGAPLLVAVVDNELYAADHADMAVRKYDKARKLWLTVERLPKRAVSMNGWGIVFRACSDRLIVIGGPTASGGRFIELNSCVPREGPPQWDLLSRKRSGNSVYNCAVMGC